MVFEKITTAAVEQSKVKDSKTDAKDAKDVKDVKPGAAQLAEDTRCRLRVLLREGVDGPSSVFDDTATYLYSTCIKIAKRNKDDIRIPFRVLKEEIGRAEYNSEASVKARQVDLLFRLYDELEDRSGNVLRDTEHPDQREAALLFEELRMRMLRLVVGETWDDATRLRGLALKKLYAYKVKELSLRRSRSTVPRTSGNGNESKLSRALSKRLSNSAVAVGTWEDTLEELGKAPASKLFPLVKLLLVEVGAMDPLSKDSSIDEPHTPGNSARGPNRTTSDALTESISKVTVDDLLDMHHSPAANVQQNGHHVNNYTANGHGHKESTSVNGRTAVHPIQAVTFSMPVDDPHADPWQAPAMPRNNSHGGFGNRPSAGHATGYVVPAPADYNIVQQHYNTPRLVNGSVNNGSPVQYAPGFDNTLLHRATSSASEAGSQSPYLGKDKPLRDNTFSDLSPL